LGIGLVLIAYRFDAPLFFANADHFLTQARELIASSIE
jgi:MFS superfamily sulfate permease-like transporter